MERKVREKIKEDLEKKMVFIVGPRQVGKTWLAKDIAKDYPGSLYLNYDDAKHRAIIRGEAWLPSTPLVIFDEIHKMHGWKNYLKGIFDTRQSTLRMLVTGSARLDAHRNVGDSLAGRYFVHHLLPFTLSELHDSPYRGDISRLLARGGFPEPFLASDTQESDRWRNLYGEALLRGDVLDFAGVDNLLAMRQVFDLLRYRVGSPVSASALARDVGISPITVRRYLGIFDALYMTFTIRPYTTKISRSILKEPKIYFYDHAFVDVSNPGARLENMVAVALFAKKLSEGDRIGAYGRLAFLRTKDGKETDFALVDAQNELEVLVEVKESDESMSPTLRYFAEKYRVHGVQLVKQLRDERIHGDLLSIRRAQDYLAE